MPWKKIALPSGPDFDAFAKEYKQKAKLLVDESLGIGVSEVLRDLEWNVRFVSEVGLLGHPDENV